jgi:serine/threonine-protein kinase
MTPAADRRRLDTERMGSLSLRQRARGGTLGAMAHPLLDVVRIDGPLVDYLRRCGEVFATITGHDSRNTSFGVAIAGDRWFVKRAAAGDTDAIRELDSAIRFHAVMRHPAIVPLAGVVHASDGLAIVYPWRAGEVLNDPFAPGALPATDPKSAFARFRALPLSELAAAIDAVFDAHVAVARAGFVAVDFYDGAVMYDFAARAIQLVDLDGYRPPYTLDRERQFGSSRFMAPEEWQRGASIDERTTVYTLGRAAFVFLGGERGDSAPELWRADSRRHAVASRATAARPADRFATVAELHRAWLAT